MTVAYISSSTISALLDVSYLGTIISIHENPFPHHQGKMSKKQLKALKLMRRNLRIIFRQLSRANVEKNPIMSIPIRPGPQNVASKETSPSDTPSLLFHYLFDDWMNTHSLVARKEHQYGVQLEQLVSLIATILSTLTYFKAREAVFQTRSSAYRGPTQGRTSAGSAKTNVRKLCSYY